MNSKLLKGFIWHNKFCFIMSFLNCSKSFFIKTFSKYFSFFIFRLISVKYILFRAKIN